MGLYFAYGSNLLRRQMAERCPAARGLTVARLEGWRFLINERGVATIAPADGQTVIGALWELTGACEAALDRFEGVADGKYEKRIVPVIADSGTRHDALTYVDLRRTHGKPYPGYLDTRVLPGAREWGLPAPYLAMLEAWL
ncbi:gamma-glutamylcyclotransferase family protein [Futiania mangrovi]|uniref:Gamma-glutamylcyclotransferase n=1 Tax=Futiania mangrovi TaxID=2959716 RepID=A0A9J6PA33_9PROT|nr:gamma-glutamylcyclotransferase family protein [Futiania mangrovii]MCP1335225.1 gamma-glutamylcyclotransferase [Futiania mangrovii]